MEKVIITSTKILYAKWNGVDEVWDKTDITKMEKPISWFLPHPVEVADGVTTQDLLLLLGKHEEHVDLVFAGYMQDCKLKDLLLELEKEPTDPTLGEKLDCIEFYWNVNLIPIDDDVAEFRLHKFPCYRGNLVSGEEEDFDDETASLIIEEFHDLSLVPLKNFRDVPIAVNDLAEFLDPGEDDELLEASILDAAYEWTFFDLVSCLLTELSLYGTPESQEAMISEIAKESEEIEKAMVFEVKDLFDYMEEFPT